MAGRIAVVSTLLLAACTGTEEADPPAVADASGPVDGETTGGGAIVDVPAPTTPGADAPAARSTAAPTPAAGVVTPGESGSTRRGTDVATTGDDCPAADHPGITDTEVLVGVPRLSQTSEVFEPLDNTQPVHEYFEVAIAAVNADGGVACRQLVPVWHELEEHPFAPSEEQAACAAWTQDHHVLAAVPVVDGPAQVLHGCLDAAGVLIVDVLGVTVRDPQGFAEVPHLVTVNSPRHDRAVREQVEALVRQGFLTSQDTIGVVHYDHEVDRRIVDGVLLPGLAAHGLSAQTRAVGTPRSMADRPDRDREAASVALRFQLAGVDRVLFVGGDGLAAAFMMAAERHQYRPWYGLTTMYLPVVTLDEVPRRQFVGARAIGWLPDADGWPVPPTDTWPARSACLTFFEGEGFDLHQPSDRQVALATCEAVGFIRAAIAAVQGPVSADAMLDGVLALGDSYASPTVGRTRFGPDRRDGAEHYRDVAWDRDCPCFEYTSRTRPLP